MDAVSNPLSGLIWGIKFICRHLVYLGVVIPLIAVGAFFTAPKIISLFGPWFDPMTLIEPIQVSNDFRNAGYTDATLQHLLVDTLGDLRKEAEGVTPSTDTARVLSEFKLPDITVPGTGLSIRPVIEFVRTLLKRDSVVYGTVVGKPSSFALILTLRDPDGRTLALSTDARPDTVAQANVSTEAQALKQALREAAKTILKHQSPLLYASYLTQDEQEQCLKGQRKCEFGEAHELFEQLAAGSGMDVPGASKENAAWALLALSKLDTYAGDYEGTIRRARRIVDMSNALHSWKKVRPWAYYNWGVALTDLGCYQRATDVLKQAVKTHKNYAPAHNALARAYLALAHMPALASASTQPAAVYRAAAEEELRIAISKSPGYQEAYVNLGDALRLPSTQSASVSPATRDDALDALDAYHTAVALNVDDAGRAYERLDAMHDSAYAKVKARITRNRPQCQTGMARSLLESWGCSDAQIDAAAMSGAASMKPVALQAEAQAKLCNKPELILPTSTPEADATGRASKIIAARGIDSAAKAQQSAPVDPMRKIAAQRG